MPAVLIVEDEADLASTLAYAFEREGFDATCVGTGAAAIAACAAHPPDVVLLDVMLPDTTGFEVCRRVRAASRVPVLMLTARGEEIDRVVGFEVGADDYVVKPFSVRELVLRVRALLRRAAPVDEAAAPQWKRFGVLAFDEAGHRVQVDGEDVALTALELKLLALLYERRGRVQPRETLLDAVWGHDVDVGERAVDTGVKRLREKLGKAGVYLETVRGAGYRMASRPPASPPTDGP